MYLYAKNSEKNKKVYHVQETPLYSGREQNDLIGIGRCNFR